MSYRNTDNGTNDALHSTKAAVRGSVKAGRAAKRALSRRAGRTFKKGKKKKKKGLIRRILSLIIAIVLFLVFLLVMITSSVFVYNMPRREDDVSYNQQLLNEFDEFKEIIGTLTEDEYNNAVEKAEERIEEAVSITLSDERNAGLSQSQIEELEEIVRDSSKVIAPSEQVTDADGIRVLAAFQLSEQLKLSEMIAEKEEASGVYVPEDLPEIMRQNMIDLKGLVIDAQETELYPSTDAYFTYEHKLSSEYLSDENAFQIEVLTGTVINPETYMIEYIYEPGPLVCTDFEMKEANEEIEVGVYEMQTHKVRGNNNEPTEVEYMTKVGTKTISPRIVYVTGVTVTVDGLKDTLLSDRIEDLFAPIKLDEVPRGYIDSTGEDILKGMCDAISRMLFGVSYDEIVAQSTATFTGTVDPKLYLLLKECLSSFAEEDLTSVRKQVLYKGLQLVKKVPYFWGGKYPFVGFCDEWNEMKVVTASGSKTTGTIRPYGLDCSGFVQWTFINVVADPIEDTHDFWNSCEEITKEELLPGDLAFYWKESAGGYMDWDHVLIFAGYNKDNNPMWLHCGASEGEVDLDTPWYVDFTSPSFDEDVITFGRLTTIDYNARLKTADPADRITADGYYETWQGIGSGEFYWPVDCYLLSSLYGPRIHPITGEYKNHNGIDFAADYGQLIYACANGTVIEADGSGEFNGGWGNYVTIKHENDLVTVYAHCSNVFVNAGDQVKAGDKIASVGSTGMSTGPHLHLEVIKDGIKVDPELYL